MVADADSSPTLKDGRYVTAGASRSTFPSSTSCMIARAVKDLEAEARMNGVCGVTTRPGSISHPEALKVHYLVVVHDAESQAGDAQLAHLPVKVGVDCDEVGTAGRWRIARSSAQSGPCTGPP